MAIVSRLAIKKLFTDSGNNLYVYSLRFKARHDVHKIDGGIGSLDNHVTVFGLIRAKVADNVQPFGSRFEVFIGKRISVRYRKIRARNFNDYHTNLGVVRRNFGRGKVSGGNIVVIPKTHMNRLSARKQFPNLRGKDAKMRASVGGGFRPRMTGENVQDAHTETAVLTLLAPYSSRKIHQRREGAVRAAQCPNAREFLRVERRALTHQSDGA